MDDPPILDRERLASISRGDAALAAEFLAVMFEDADALLEQLSALVAGGDRLAVSDVAHTIKGNATELGAMHLRDAAAALETELQPARWPQSVEHVRVALDELRSYV